MKRDEDQCTYTNSLDGTCEHPDNLTPECHRHICPLADSMRSVNEIRERLNTIRYDRANLRECLREGRHSKSPIYLQKDIEVLEGQIAVLGWVLDDEEEGS